MGSEGINGKRSLRITHWIPSEFSTENESAFLSGQNPKKQQTSVFIDRFFRQMPFLQIAEKHNISRQKVSGSYSDAKKRIEKVVKAMDRSEHAKSHERTQIKMQRNVRIFFLFALFELSVTEIANMMGMHQSHVSRDIALVRDRFLTGELEIFCASDKVCIHKSKKFNIE